MTTIFMTILTRKQSLDEILETLNSSIHKKRLSLYIVTEKNNPIVKKIKENSNNFPIILDTYPVGTSEDSMISASLTSLEDSEILLVRDNAKTFSSENIDLLLNESMLGNDIVLLKKNNKTNKIKQFFSNSAQKLCKLFFGFTYYDGDIGMQFFSKSAHSILKTTNLTKMTKLNRWLALNISYVDAKLEQTQILTKIPKKSLILGTTFFSLFVATLIFLIVLQSLVKISFIGGMLFLLAFVVFFALGLYNFIDIYSHKKVGNLSAEKAYILEHFEGENQ